MVRIPTVVFQLLRRVRVADFYWSSLHTRYGYVLPWYL